MNLECSNEIKENIFNNEVVLLRIKEQIFCFSVTQIRKLIETKPFYVVQLSDQVLKQDGTVINSLIFRQSKPEQQVLKLGYYFSVKYDFISAFNASKNTFELTNPVKNLLFRDKKNILSQPFFTVLKLYLEKV